MSTAGSVSTAMSAADRGTLAREIERARGAAEDAARAALGVLGVEEREKPSWLYQEDLALRRALRARARQLGGDGGMDAGLPLLVEEVAYEAWHRMLFARFLAEHRLLRHPSGTPVSLRDCAELAEEEGIGDAWELAARYASSMLPGLFRAGDPSACVRFAPEGTKALESVLERLPKSTFSSDDGIGWIYQFWQARKKEEVNQSGRKIGGADIAPVTQLFTEEYMVRFLLENSLGAWWATRHPDSPLIKKWMYLRVGNDCTPAAGDFRDWPARAAEVTVMDPCCGSGHFLVAAFSMLQSMRMEEEGLSAAESADAVLRDNLFGLELDLRCTQIATFAVALAAWKEGGSPERCPPRIACSGVPVKGALADWRRIANGDTRLTVTLEALYELFKEAPTLGSLIDPRRATQDQGLFRLDWETVGEALERVSTLDAEASIFAYAAEDAVRAATLLGRTYTLVTTNVPYLSRGKQDKKLAEYADKRHKRAKGDLATMFLERCLSFCGPGGSVSVVMPTNWMYLGSYRALREDVLATTSLNIIAVLGPAAFGDMNWWAIRTGLYLLTNAPPSLDQAFHGFDLGNHRQFEEKAALVREHALIAIYQQAQQDSPDSRIIIGEAVSAELLSRYAGGYAGIQTGDYSRFGRCFWELAAVVEGWELQQSTVPVTVDAGGREHVLLWEGGRGSLLRFVEERLGKFGVGAWIRGTDFAGRQGVAVSSMGNLPVTRYCGELFDNNTAVILPMNLDHLPAIWAFCSSAEFNTEVRKIDSALKVTNASLVKVPFDLERWQKIAAKRYPDGLPEPHSSDPTQWLFQGLPKGSTAPLQVAVAFLAGYRWPEQMDEDEIDAFADTDGILCLPPVFGEQPAAERLRALLAHVYGDAWSPALRDKLLADAGSSNKDLAQWLRDDFWYQHCKLFHNRPFIWHIWDGARDGFAALVNYHKLDVRLLEKLTYTHLGTWIGTQRAAQLSGEPGADARLVAALKLQGKLAAILEGSPPFDTYVRWKPLHEQPIGWEPDLNDGIRVNIRPFVAASILRGKLTVKWNKDRGSNPHGSDSFRWSSEAQHVAGIAKPDGALRLNDLHLPISAKQAAREAAAVAVP